MRHQTSAVGAHGLEFPRSSHKRRLVHVESADDFDLHGVPQEQYDENELYVSGIDSASVIGAEVLPGDWDLEHLRITEEGPSEEPEEGEEGEIDYDEGAEVVKDEE